MNNLWTDTGYISLNHVNEQLCGDRVEIIGNNEKSLTMVLADGLGSGVKANILSTLTSKIICTMMANGMPIEECVDTIAKTLPVCSVRQVAYSTFTIIRITDNTTAEIIQFDNPNVILLRNGKSVDYPIVSRVIEGKTILESRIPLQLHDVFIAMSDGAIYAGVGKTMNFGWQRENIIEYAERLYDDTLSAKMIASMIVDECNRLYEGEPGDDTTVAAVRIRERTPVNLLMGPPADPRDATKMMTLFFSKEGKKIVCGGTTSQIAADYLHETIVTSLDYGTDPAIPPVGHMKGVDLVTEGEWWNTPRPLWKAPTLPTCGACRRTEPRKSPSFCSSMPRTSIFLSARPSIRRTRTRICPLPSASKYAWYRSFPNIWKRWANKSK